MIVSNSNVLEFKKNYKDKRTIRCEIFSIVICLVAGIALIEANLDYEIWNSIEKSGQQLRADPQTLVQSSTQTIASINILFQVINEHLSFQSHHFIIKRLLQKNEGQNNVGSITQSVLIVIIVIFIVLPVVSLIIFGVILIYRRCQDDQQHQQAFQQPAQSHINIDNYKIDEIGPYLSNPNDQCSICLDKEVNLRTFCGHFFHGPCFKTWYDKKANDGRKMTCPVCVGTQINPIKIYCKKCHVSGKLDVIYHKTSTQKIQELSSFICIQCKDLEQIRSEVTGKDVKKVEPETNESNEVRMHSAEQLYVGHFI